jgi:hypothetical protein
MIQERYRRDYDGEFIIVRTTIKNGQKLQEREWIPNPIENNYISARAAVIGSGASRERFPILRLQNHKGGLLGKKRLQTYGSEGCWKELQCDFYIDTIPGEHQQLIQNQYNERVAVYTNAKTCVAYPGEFYMIPYNVNLITDAGLAMYVAAFDGHREIYCVGVDGLDSKQNINRKAVAHIATVLKTYTKTQFVFVNNSDNLHPSWRQHKNVSAISYREFITSCDI